MASPPENLWTIAKAASMLGVTAESVRNFVRAGDITPAATITSPSNRVTLFFRPADVLALIAKRADVLRARADVLYTEADVLIADLELIRRAEGLAS